jgi:hypothetical protein
MSMGMVAGVPGLTPRDASGAMTLVANQFSIADRRMPGC